MRNHIIALALGAGILVGASPAQSAGNVSAFSLSRISIAAGIEWHADERIGTAASPLLEHQSEWGVAIPIAYNVGYPGSAAHPFTLTYTPALGLDNQQIRHTFRASYVFKKGGS